MKLKCSESSRNIVDAVDLIKWDNIFLIGLFIPLFVKVDSKGIYRDN